VNVGPVDPSKTQVLQSINGIDTQIFTTSFVNLDNNNKLPIFKLAFFDVINNSRLAEDGWIYTATLSIVNGANSNYVLTP